MKLLYLCSDYGISASGTKGASEHLRAFLRSVVHGGHEVCFLSPRPGGDDIPGVSRVLPPGCEPVDRAVKPLKQWLDTTGLDGSLAADMRGLMYSAWAPQEAFEALASSPPDAIVERYALFSHVGVDLADRLDIPLILEVNALLTEEASAYRTLCLGDLAMQIEQRVFKRADAFATVSSELASRLVQTGIPAGRVHVVPNGADPDVFEKAIGRAASRAALGLESNDFVIGFTGSLKPWHGVPALIESFARLACQIPDAKLLVVGTGPMEADLRRRVVALNLQQRVVFTGGVPHDQIPDLISAMDVGTAPYPAQNGFYFSPLKVFEYMAAGLCVVAPALGQIRDLIQNEINGLLYDPACEHGLYDALCDAYSCATRRDRLGSAAKQTITEHYTWRHSACAVLELVEHAIQLRAKPTHNGRHTAASGVGL